MPEKYHGMCVNNDDLEVDPVDEPEKPVEEEVDCPDYLYNCEVCAER
jgi:hypothetical protein